MIDACICLNYSTSPFLCFYSRFSSWTVLTGLLEVHVVFLYCCYQYFQVHDPNLMRKPTPDPYAFYIASYESAAALFNDLMVKIREWLILPVACYLIFKTALVRRK